VTGQQAADYAKAGVDLSSTSPLLIAAVMQANVGQESVTPLPPPSPESSLVEQRKALLEAYKAKTGASNRKIYTARNSGIHKPQFSEWCNGILPNTSATTLNFERFLREQRPPVPRNPKT